MHSTGGLVAPEFGLNGCEKEKILLFLLGFQPVASLYTDYAAPVPVNVKFAL
jgi:hypothetical protein